MHTPGPKMVSNRQHAIEIGIKTVSQFSYSRVGQESFFGEPLTVADCENGLRAECTNLLTLIAMTDDQYDARSEASNA